MTTSPDDDRPEYLRVLFPRRDKGSATPRPAVSAPQSRGDMARYAARALDAELATLASAPEGRRNDQLNAAAFNLSQLVAGGVLPHGLVWESLRSTALGIGLTSAETENTLRSAFAAGEREPRGVPDREPIPEATVLHLAPLASAVHDAAEGDEPAVDIAALFPIIDWRALFEDETVDEWILEPLIPARRLVALYSPPKMGKSLLMLEIAVGISRGLTTLGAKVDRPYKVLYIDFENDPRGDIRTRLRAMGLSWHHLDNLKYLPFPSLAALDTFQGGAEVLAVSRYHECEVVIIDTISRAIVGEENANDTWLQFYRHTGSKLKADGRACVRLDHSGKDVAKGMRGGSAKYGDVDAVWSMTQLADLTFELECTANRLPIAEKRLTITREPGPPLRHRVDMTFKRTQFDQRVANALEAIPRLDPPVPPSGDGSGFKQVYRRLLTLGVDTSQNATQRALEVWRGTVA